MEDEDNSPPSQLTDVVVTAPLRGGSGLQRFISTMGALEGAARGAYFAVEISAPNIRGNDALNYTYLCQSASLPGVSINTDDTYMPQGFGFVEQMPWGLSFTNNMVMTFIADNKGQLMGGMHDWMEQIVPFNTESDQAETLSGRPMVLKYKRSYAGVVKLHHYDPKRDKISTYTLHDAFPKQISEAALSMTDGDYMRFSVNLAYTRWTVERHKDNSAPARPADGISTAVNRFSDAPGRAITPDAYDLRDLGLDLLSGAVNGRSLGNQMRGLLGNAVNNNVTTFISGIADRTPPALQDVYKRALPLLGGIGDFRF